jgi:hypothetical protein
MLKPDLWFNVRYAELLAIPKEKRSVKAQLQILAYERMQNMKEEVASIRKERDTSRLVTIGGTICAILDDSWMCYGIAASFVDL